MLAASEGIIVIMVLILVFGILSRPLRSERNRSGRETGIEREIPTGQAANGTHEAGYSAASKGGRPDPDPYSKDQKVVVRVK
jgi:hypothetical protein